MNARRPPVGQWVEETLQADAHWNPRGYYERTAGIIAAMHERVGPFVDARWDYLAEDLNHLRSAVERYCSGRILDLGCGEGYWIKHYAARAQAVTLIDSSPKLLSCGHSMATEKFQLPAQALALDVLREPDDVPFVRKDTILIAFVLSHYSQAEVVDFLRHVRQKADARTSLLILDSWYSPVRRRKRPQESLRTIVENSGRHSVRKRYVTKAQWAEIVRASGMEAIWHWWGKAFFACRCMVPPVDE